jgi:hypothetical protein
VYTLFALNTCLRNIFPPEAELKIPISRIVTLPENTKFFDHWDVPGLENVHVAAALSAPNDVFSTPNALSAVLSAADPVPVAMCVNGAAGDSPIIILAAVSRPKLVIVDI